MKRSIALALAGACPPTVLAAADTRYKAERRDKPERTGSTEMTAAGSVSHKKL